MATALIVTPARDRAGACCDAFRRSGFFPFVVDSVDAAVNVLNQFRTDLIVVQTSLDDGVDASNYERLLRAAGETRLIATSELSTISAEAWADIRQVRPSARRQTGS
jgi:DNA-binding response OmpR family regulator